MENYFNSKKLTFLQFIKTLKNDDSPLGDLCSDILRDKSLFNPKYTKFKQNDTLTIHLIFWKVTEVDVQIAFHKLLYRFLFQKQLWRIDVPMYNLYFENFEELF